MNIYVGNLSSKVDENDLRKAFEVFGQIESVNVIKDKISGRSRGFGFVVMPDTSEADRAIEGLNGTELLGKTITVNEARSRSERRGGGKGSDGRQHGGWGGGFGGGRHQGGGFKGGIPGGGKRSGGRGDR
jgi:RNA recognition motif-containing protein